MNNWHVGDMVNLDTAMAQPCRGEIVKIETPILCGERANRVMALVRFDYLDRRRYILHELWYNENEMNGWFSHVDHKIPMVYVVYSIFPGGDYQWHGEFDHIGQAKRELRDQKSERIDEFICDPENSSKWQNTTPLRQITRKMLELGSIEYGSVIAPENIGSPCLVERENLCIAYEESRPDRFDY